MHKPRQSRFSSIPWDLRNEAHILTKTTLNCSIIAPGTIKMKKFELDNIPKKEHAGREGSSLLIQPLLNSSSKGELDSPPPWLWHFPGWGFQAQADKAWEKNLAQSPPMQPWHREAAWQLGQREGALVPNPITPSKSPPLFFQPQYFRNQLKSRWFGFLSGQFWKHHSKEKKKKKKQLHSYCSQNLLKKKLFTPSRVSKI